jgi:hypothetical protein
LLSACPAIVFTLGQHGRLARSDRSVWDPEKRRSVTMSNGPVSDGHFPAGNGDPAQRNTVGNPAPPDRSWRRFSPIRSLLFLLIPLAGIVAINLTLLAAFQFTDSESEENVAAWYSFVDFNRENSTPTWLNASLWVMAGLVAGYIARHVTEHRASWRLFAFVCFYISVDEAISLHERLEPIGEQLNSGLAFAWVIPGLVIAAVVVLLLARMVLGLPAIARNGLVISGIVFVIGSVGVETIAGFVRVRLEQGGLYALLGTVEESLEIAGVSLCVASLLYLIEHRLVDGGIAYRISASRHR